MLLIVLTVAIISILVLALRFTVARSVRWAAGRPSMAAAVVSSALGLALTFFFGNPLLEDLEEKEWPVVEGIVTRSEITGERAISPTIEYSYAVNGTTYRTQTHVHAPMFGGKRKKLDVAETLVEKYPVGRKLNVHYNPGQPSRSTLTPGPTWDMYTKPAFGLVLFGAGLFVLFCLRRK